MLVVAISGKFLNFLHIQAVAMMQQGMIDLNKRKSKEMESFLYYTLYYKIIHNIQQYRAAKEWIS